MSEIQDFGPIYALYLAHSADENIRFKASSGGFSKSFLVFLLESDRVDEVIITRTGGPDQPLVPETVITHSREDILSTRTNSVYAVNNALSVLKDIQPSKRYALVGLPCQVKTLKNLQKKGLYTNIRYVISLFCGHTPLREFTPVILEKLKITEADVNRIEYRGHGWPGGFTAFLKNGEQKYIPVSEYWQDSLDNGPEMCRRCGEIGKEADIATCDPWHLGLENIDRSGQNIVICRNSEIDNLVSEAVDKGYLEIAPCSPTELIKSQSRHVDLKIARAFSSRSLQTRIWGAVRHPVRIIYFGFNLSKRVVRVVYRPFKPVGDPVIAVLRRLYRPVKPVVDTRITLIQHDWKALGDFFNPPDGEYFVHQACKIWLLHRLLRPVFRNSVLVWYWREEKKEINFGDYITELLLKSFGYRSIRYADARELNVLDKFPFCIFMIGSELHKDWINDKQVSIIYVWGAGKGRGEFFDIKSEPYRSKVKLFAVRGRNTIRQLKLDPATTVGDPGYLMPLFYPVTRDPAQNIVNFIPHLSNRSRWQEKLKEVGAERYIDIFCTRREFFARLRSIVSSRFVLTSTLHTTIICQAYRVPYAVCLAEGDILDCPDKWDDMFGLSGIEKQFRTVRNLQEGLQWWGDVGSKARPVDVVPLLKTIPLPVKNRNAQQIIERAIAGSE